MNSAIAHHPPMSLSPSSDPAPANYPSLYTEHIVVWYRISLWQFGSTVLVVVPHSFSW